MVWVLLGAGGGRRSPEGTRTAACCVRLAPETGSILAVIGVLCSSAFGGSTPLAPASL